MIKKATVGIFLMLLMLGILSTMLNLRLVRAWSNGGYSTDPNNPNYGTHDWIAQHALDWLPAEEKQYILDNLPAYLYGTELPDNSGAPDGIGDTVWHHVYFNESEIMFDDRAAFRASWESERVMYFLDSGDLTSAAKCAGTMGHYLADVAVFGHVMAANTPWGAETHHSDYEYYVNERTNNYTDEFDSYLQFDGSLTLISAYNATKNLAYDTTFDTDGDLTCVWMDQNYNWTDPVFRNRAGESLNLAVNYLADVLHTIYAKVHGGQEKVTVFPTSNVGLLFENITQEGTTTANITQTGPDPPPTRTVKKYCYVETTANYSDKIELKMIYDIDIVLDSGKDVSPEEEESLQLMQWNETTLQWENITAYVDIKNNLVVGEASHLSIFGVTCMGGDKSIYQFPVTVGSKTFNINVATNSTMSEFIFDQQNKALAFIIQGENGTAGFCNVTVPEILLGGPYTLRVDNATISQGFNPPSNGTHSFIYFTYDHSLHMVEIIGTTVVPELTPSIMIPLFMLATSVAVMALRRKKYKIHYVDS